MRITDRMIVNRTVQNLQEHRYRLGNAQTQVATGRKLIHISDDPADTERAMMLMSEIRLNEEQVSNLAMSRDWLNATDAAVTNFNDLLTEIRGLALTAMNDTNSDTELKALSQQTQELLENALSIANTRHGDYYIFSGYQIQTKPFEIAADGTVVYNGDDQVFEHMIEPGQTMPINFTGISGKHGGIKNALVQIQLLQQAMETGNRTQIEAYLDKTSDINADMATIQSAVGARVQRIDGTVSHLQQRDVDLRKLYGQLVDADMASTIAEMTAEDRAYELSLAAASRVLPRSLLDFLR